MQMLVITSRYNNDDNISSYYYYFIIIIPTRKANMYFYISISIAYPYRLIPSD